MATATRLRPIRTERLLLRERDPEADAADIFDFWKDPEVVKYTTRPPYKSAQEVKDFQLRGVRPNTEQFLYAVTIPFPSTAIRTSHPDLVTETTATPVRQGQDADAHPRSDHKTIGVMGIHKLPELGYTLHPSYHNRGLMSEALRAVLQEIWRLMPSIDNSEGKHGFDHIIAICDTENVASQRVLEKAGFTRGEVIEREYESPVLGVRDGVAFYLARPGTTLPEVCFKGMGEEEAPVPDVQ